MRDIELKFKLRNFLYNNTRCNFGGGSGGGAPAPVPSPIPRKVEVDVAAAEKEERDLAARRRGRSRSLLTQNVDFGRAETSKSQLLGL